MFKYRFMGFDYTVLNNEIIDTLSDMVIIINNEEEIIRVNYTANAALSNGPDDVITGKKLSQVLDIDQRLKDRLSKLFEGKTSQIRDSVRYKKNNCTVCVSSYFAEGNR